MYDKFDDDAKKSGLRLDGNEPTFDGRKIRKIVKRLAWVAFIILFIVVFFIRQEYNINRRDLYNLHIGGIEGAITSRRGSMEINERTLVVESGRIVVSQIHYVYGAGAGYRGGQVRFHLLVPNPFFSGDLYAVEFDVMLGNTSIDAPATFLKSFWWCQMLNVTLTFREDVSLPWYGETITINISGEGIKATLSFEMP